MPTDPTTAEKAERLGLTKCATPNCSCQGTYWLDGDGVGRTDGEVDAAYRKAFPEPGVTIRPGGGGGGGSGMPHGVGGFTGSVILDATKPAPDYRAALEALVGVAEQIESAGPGHEDWGALTRAISHARTVLHGQ